MHGSDANGVTVKPATHREGETRGTWRKFGGSKARRSRRVFLSKERWFSQSLGNDRGHQGGNKIGTGEKKNVEDLNAI